MSQTASQRPRLIITALIVVVLLVAAGLAYWQLGDDDSAEPLSAPSDSPSASPPTTSSTPEPTEETPEAEVECEGPDTQFNVEGVVQESLLPDCGTTPVTVEQERKDGLGLACGGAYPVILFKTTTSGAKTSICGKDASGASFRFVTQPDGGQVIDLPGTYDPERDAFTARQGDVRYAVTAYNGELLVTENGATTAQASDGDWISLDNESDYD